jgi:hypothetical protein
MIDGQRSDRSKELPQCLLYEIQGRGVRDHLSGSSDRDLGQPHEPAQHRSERFTLLALSTHASEAARRQRHEEDGLA